jgi:hypothetical protein
MVENNSVLGDVINSSEIFTGIWDSMPKNLTNGIGFIFMMIKIILIAVFVYYIILIIIRFVRFIFGTKEARNLKIVSKQLDVTNAYLEQIVVLMSGNKHKKLKEKILKRDIGEKGRIGKKENEKKKNK